MGDDISSGLSSMAVCFDFRSTNIVQLSNRNLYFYRFRCHHPLITQLTPGPCITLCFVLGKSVVIQNHVKKIMNLAKRGFLHLCQFWNPVVVLVKFVSCKKLVYSIHIFIQLHFHHKFMFIHSIPIRKIIENLVKTHKNSNVSSENFQPYCVKK